MKTLGNHQGGDEQEPSVPAIDANGQKECTQGPPVEREGCSSKRGAGPPVASRSTVMPTLKPFFMS